MGCVASRAARTSVVVLLASFCGAPGMPANLSASVRLSWFARAFVFALDHGLSARGLSQPARCRKRVGCRGQAREGSRTCCTRAPAVSSCRASGKVAAV